MKYCMTANWKFFFRLEHNRIALQPYWDASGVFSTQGIKGMMGEFFHYSDLNAA
jgi:hypothetical protein